MMSRVAEPPHAKWRRGAVTMLGGRRVLSALLLFALASVAIGVEITSQNEYHHYVTWKSTAVKDEMGSAVEPLQILQNMISFQVPGVGLVVNAFLKWDEVADALQHINDPMAISEIPESTCTRKATVEVYFKNADYTYTADGDEVNQDDIVLLEGNMESTNLDDDVWTFDDMRIEDTPDEQNALVELPLDVSRFGTDECISAKEMIVLTDAIWYPFGAESGDRRVLTQRIFAVNLEYPKKPVTNQLCSVDTSVQKLFFNCQTTGFCDQLEAMMKMTLAESCAEDGPSGPGLDMCADDQDTSKQCQLCKHMINVFKVNFDMGLESVKKCGVPESLYVEELGGTCRQLVKEVASTDWKCANLAKNLTVGLPSATDETDLSELCLESELCDADEEGDCAGCAKILQVARTLGTMKTIDLSKEQDVVEFCYFVTVYGFMMGNDDEESDNGHGGETDKPQVEQQDMHGDGDDKCGETCSADDGCFDTGMCVLTSEITESEGMNEKEEELVVDECSWHTDRDTCNMQGDCVFVGTPPPYHEGSDTFCDDLETMINAYGLEILDSAEKSAFAAGACGTQCGVGCASCDGVIASMSSLSLLKGGGDAQAVGKTARMTCESMTGRQQQLPIGTCVPKEKAKCLAAKSKMTCEEQGKTCTYMRSCQRMSPGPDFCKMANPSNSSRPGAACGALETCGSILEDVNGLSRRDICGKSGLNLCPGTFCADCYEASDTAIPMLKELKPEDEYCPYADEMSREEACFSQLSEIADAKAACGNMMTVTTAILKGDYAGACEDSEDTKDCMDVTKFVHDLIKNGHLQNSTDGVERACRELGGDWADMEKMLMVYGNLRCDPTNNGCCDKLDDGEGGLYPSRDQCLERPHCEFDPPSIPKCILAEDECAKYFQDTFETDGDGVCASGCEFVETTDFRALPLECHVRSSSDFGCDREDECCVASTTKTIEPADCSSDKGCSLHKRCKRVFDPCNRYHNEWECAKDRDSCTWHPERDLFDPFAGNCVGIRDECEELGETECDTRMACMLVDRCEKNECDEGDQCCPLSMNACQAEKTCQVSGECLLRRDDCSYLDDEASCKEMDECQWDGSSCSLSDNPCHDVSQLHCRTKRDENGGSLCKWDALCVDKCSICKDCIDAMAVVAAANADVTNSNTVAKSAMAACVKLGIDRTLCRRRLYLAVVFSQSGSFGKRPMAVCSKINECSGDCTFTVDGAEMEPDFCTASGLSATTSSPTRKLLGLQTDTTCFKTADCTSPAYCSFVSPVDTCSCNPFNGRDKCIAKGTCQDFCDQFTDQMAAVNGRYTNCAVDGDCSTGNTCDTSSNKSRCRVLSCTNAGLSSSVCDGICVPSGREITAAKFNNDGNQITATLNFPAPKRGFACSKAFDTATVTLLGSRAYCFTTETELTIYLRKGATVAVGDTLTLDSSQTAMKDTLGGSFSGGVTVTTCDSCVAPEVNVVFPAILSAGCSGTSGSALFDATYSIDTAGRVLTSSWSIDESACYRATSSDSFTTSSDCTAIKTLIDAAGDSASLEVGGTVVSSLTAGDYKITYTGTNFLGVAKTQDIIFTKSATAVPVVGIIGGTNEFDFMLKDGVRVFAFVDITSVCEGYTVDYEWTSLDTPEWSALEGGYTRKNFILPGPVTTAQAQNDYNIRLTATLKDASGVIQGSVTQDVLLHAHGSPITPRIEGKYGDVLLSGDVCMDVSASIDPDDPEQQSSFAVVWTCEKNEIGGEACFTGTDQPDIEGSQLCIPPELLTAGEWYYYTAKIMKTDVGLTTVTRSASATIVFRPIPADSKVPLGSIEMQCGALDCPAYFNPTDLINLMVTVDSSYASETTIEWSCDGIDDLEGNSLGGINLPNLLIKPDTIDGGAEITCTATLTRTDVEADTGTAVRSFKMNSPPYCGAANDACLTVSQTSDSNTYPDAVYKARAREFIDEGSRMVYVFGEYIGSNPQVFVTHKRSTGTTFNFRGLEEGEHLLAVKVYDTYGAFTEQTKTITIDAPAEDYVPDLSVLTAAKEDFLKGQQAGDPVEVFTQSRKAVGLLKRASGGNGISESEGKELAASFTAACTSQVSDNPEDVNVDEYLIAQGVLGELSQNNFTQPSDIDMMMDAALNGLTGSEYGNVAYSADQCIDILNMCASGIKKRQEAGESTDSVEFFDKFKSIMKKCSALSCLKATPGTDPVASGSSAEGFDPIAMACQRETTTGLNGKSLKVGAKNGGGRRRLAAFVTEEADVTLPADFADKCGEYCPETQMATSIQFFTDTSSHETLLGTLVTGVGITNDVIVSGILDIDFPDHLGEGELCPSESCTLTAKIPIDAEKWKSDAGTVTICMLIEDGVAVSGSSSGIEYVEDSYDPSTGLATCNSTMYGEMLVAQYSAPPPPPPPPPPTPPPPAPFEEDSEAPVEAPAPSPATSSAPAPAPATTPAEADPPVSNPPQTKKAEVQIKFPGDYNTLKNDQEFLTGVTDATADAAKVDRSNVKIVSTRAGSIIVEMEVEFPADRNDNEIQDFTDEIESDPRSVLAFDSSFTDKYGKPQPAEKKKKGGPNVGLIAGLVAGITALVVLIVVAVLIAARRKKYTNVPSGSNYEPA
ncbi:hypothetical protein BSKO_14002 [Bryopsis sp. KO-2023]|nr:hypothetical protein BSKO_14002 [Bryopsis sp. KO-2023]